MSIPKTLSLKDQSLLGVYAAAKQSPAGAAKAVQTLASTAQIPLLFASPLSDLDDLDRAIKERLAPFIEEPCAERLQAWHKEMERIFNVEDKHENAEENDEKKVFIHKVDDTREFKLAHLLKWVMSRPRTQLRQFEEIMTCTGHTVACCWYIFPVEDCDRRSAVDRKRLEAKQKEETKTFEPAKIELD